MPKSKVLAYRIKDEEMRERMFHSYRGPRLYENGVDYIILCVMPYENFYIDGEIDRHKLADAIPLDLELQYKNELISSGRLETNEVVYILIDQETNII